jgi:hypothetical protein
LKRKTNSIKGTKIIIKRMRTKLKKLAYLNLELNEEIKNKSKFYKKIKNKN